jgi:ATP-binding cassette subfamily A (ABC1) protein 3
VVGIALALIPGSIVSRVLGEKEKGLYHIQVVSGVDLRAYWISNFVFDLIMCYIPCISISLLMYWFDLGYHHVWKALALLPWAVIPYTYVFSFLFE